MNTATIYFLPRRHQSFSSTPVRYNLYDQRFRALRTRYVRLEAYDSSSQETEYIDGDGCYFKNANSRSYSVAVALGVSVAVLDLRVVPVVVRPHVMPNLVDMRKIGEAVRVHHRVAILGESGGRTCHGKPGHPRFVSWGFAGGRSSSCRTIRGGRQSGGEIV